MPANYSQSSFRMLLLIATPKLIKKAAAMFEEGNVPVQYVFHAQGTASSEVLDMLGLGVEEKRILMSMLPKEFADEMLKKLRKTLHLGMPNSGVAFTLAMSGGSGSVIRLMESLSSEKKQTILRRDGLLMENEYSLIMAIVNQGFTEDVMDAARPVGATGGTAFHSRRIGSEEAMRFWGISVQQEREIVLILARKEDKIAIMKAIGEKCGIKSSANGMVLSLPVDGVVGLN